MASSHPPAPSSPSSSPRNFTSVTPSTTVTAQMAPHVSPLVNAETLATLEATLLNTSGKVPLHNRYRALFTLKALKSDESINIIAKCFKDKNTLLKHELAYVLGQMGNTAALPILESVVEDLDQHPMVRHEVCPTLCNRSLQLIRRSSSGC
ncbi:hypothetical protein NM688_g8686 [Phlebia brevispora]|uniref:Uncharacterized protein n=1 Tax=Phlebia brevispora TaxID=194682 RepID=A0ACC1RPC8_9APHY|nr:hypothetical protein NM688_g8686 [Phlebia brevispora]